MNRDADGQPLPTTATYYVVVAIRAKDDGRRVGHETIRVTAYSLQEAVVQAAMEVGARNSIYEHGWETYIIWVGPALQLLLPVASKAVDAYWLAQERTAAVLQ